MSVQPLDTATSLSTAMRVGSRADHEAAEGSTFMEELLGGRINEAGYAAYLQRLRPVYEALESVARELAAAGDPIASAVIDPVLERLASIDTDLEHWAPATTDELDSPASAAYVARIRESAAWGGLFAAHHYTRYLGDLSGGQAIGRILDRAFSLDGAGIAFYDFTAIEKPKLYKDAYRARLDDLGLSEDEIERVVAEVRVAFGMNQALFAELSEQIETFRR
jgi:heme oxygenase (biliverdin-producing, ferredoxin)